MAFEKSQLDKFKKSARMLERDDDPERFKTGSKTREVETGAG